MVKLNSYVCGCNGGSLTLCDPGELPGGAVFLLESLLFEVVPLDPLTFVGVPVLFLAMAVGVALASAQRAIRRRR